MGEWSQSIMAGIRERWTMELDTAGLEMVDDLRTTISVPVEYLDSGYVIRSSPGEPPRKEFGQLWANCEHTVSDSGVEPVLAVLNATEYARRLEYGDGSRLKPRPFFGPLRERWRNVIGPRLLQSLSTQVA